jgi:ABC-type Zn uptake system ZnuABC Zn-binding protein ZnuA
MLSGFLLGILLSACSPEPDVDLGFQDDQLLVVTTTTFLGDVINNITGNDVDLVVLLQPGQNPHSYSPSPQDMVSLSEADLLIINGFGLEEFLDEMLEGSDYAASLVVASEGVPALDAGEDEHEDEGEHEENGHADEDPHVWLNPNNVIVWVENITQALADADPENAEYYQLNANSYLQQLLELDDWIKQQISLIPEKNRDLVSDHNSLAYFAEEYGLHQIGAVIPAQTTEAETSGLQLANLIETIRENQTRAIFVGVDFDPTLAQRVAEETGVELVRLYFGSLSDGLQPELTWIS